MTKKNRIDKKAFLIPLYVSLCLLTIPLFANVLVTGFDWTFYDFIVIDGLIYSITFTLLIVLRIIQNTPYRFVIIIAILLVFILIYIDLAVGVFDLPWSGT